MENKLAIVLILGGGAYILWKYSEKQPTYIEKAKQQLRAAKEKIIEKASDINIGEIGQAAKITALTTGTTIGLAYGTSYLYSRYKNK